VYLTPLGVEKRKLAKDVVRGFNDYLESQLSGKEKEQLIEMLAKVNELAINYEPDVVMAQE